MNICISLRSCMVVDLPRDSQDFPNCDIDGGYCSGSLVEECIRVVCLLCVVAGDMNIDNTLSLAPHLFSVMMDAYV